MALFSKDIQTMEDLFDHMLQDIYYAEKKIVKSLPTMIDKARDASLKQGLSEHLQETRGHVTRLEDVFRMIGRDASAVDCPAIDGIIKEAGNLAGDIEDKEVLDAAIIAAAQAVEHYEITRYGTLIAWANRLGHQDAAELLGRTLEEEREADSKLTDLAETGINAEAAAVA